LVLDEAQIIAMGVRRSASLAVHAAETALLELALGRPRAGLERIAAFVAAGHREPWSSITSLLCAVEARLCIAAGEPHIAQRLLRDRPWSATISRAAVELAVASDDLRSARAVLDEWPVERELQSELDRWIWSAIVDDLDGRHAAALRGIEHALTL